MRKANHHFEQFSRLLAVGDSSPSARDSLLTAEGSGETRRVSYNTSEAEREENRRVNIIAYSNYE